MDRVFGAIHSRIHWNWQLYIFNYIVLRKSYYDHLEALIPGTANFLVNLQLYAMIGSLFMLILPVLSFACFFRKLGVVWDIIVGVAAFIFYIPTYVAVMPIYARCHLDDLSSAGNLGKRNQKLKDSWKIIKMIDVSKYFIWNVIASAVLLLTSQYILVKFFVLLVFFLIFIISQLIRFVPVLIYEIGYKLNQSSNPL